MLNLPKDFLVSFTKSRRKVSLIEFIQGIYLLRRPLLVTCDVVIAHEKKKTHIWSLDYFEKLLTRVICSDLEVLASICLGNRSYTHASLMLVPILNKGINVTLSCLQQTGQKSTTVSMILRDRKLAKFYGPGDRKQSFQMRQ